MSSNNQNTLRFITCGSVDDGKSTLMGRMLFENNSIYKVLIQRLYHLIFEIDLMVNRLLFSIFLIIHNRQG